MRYYLDCEFIEDGKTIDLISIGILADDGRAFYALNADCDLSKASAWVKDNVLSCLPPQDFGSDAIISSWVPKAKIAKEVKAFCSVDTPVFWGEWCAYDWVALCQLLGTMMDLPEGWPMYCNDVISLANAHGVTSKELPPSLETDGNHNALLGAKTVKARLDWLNKHRIGRWDMPFPNW